MRKHSIFWAILLLGGGALLVIHALGLGTGIGLFATIASLLLLAVSVMSFVDLNFTMALLPFPIIAYLWRDTIGFPNMNIWYLLLAALLVGIGLDTIFWRAKRKRFSERHPGHWKHTDRCDSNGEWTGSITSEDDSDNIVVETSFGEQVKYVRSQNLKSARILNRFGSCKVYFDQCSTSPEGFELYIDNSFGAIVCYVPRNWNIDNQAKVFAGAVEGATMTAVDGIKIRLTGNVSFGDCKFISV